MDVFNHDGSVTFEPIKHTYTYRDGTSLTSVSKVLQSVKVPFDSEGISMRMAKGDPVKQAEILAEWEAKKDSSIDRGNWIHDALEQYVLNGTIDPELEDIAKNHIRPLIKQAHRIYPEALIYSTHYQVSGQSDLVIQRQRSNKSVFDFFDYKTNEAKGIEFDSVNRKKDPPTHYNRFMLPPLDHLEDCNFNHYAMQLSCYAYMSQLTWGIKVGRLAILFIDNNLKLHVYPVPYLKLEAEALLKHHLSLKPLPQNVKVENPLKTEDQKNQDDWDDNW